MDPLMLWFLFLSLKDWSALLEAMASVFRDSSDTTSLPEVQEMLPYMLIRIC